MERLYKDCMDLIRKRGDDRYVFQIPIQVKRTPHTPPVVIEAVFIQDGVLHVASATESHAANVNEVGSVYQRLKSLP